MKNAALVLICLWGGGAIVGGTSCGGEGVGDARSNGDAKLVAAAGALNSEGGDPRFFIPPPDPGAIQQIAALARARNLADAARMVAMEATPQAVWFTDGSPQEVRAAVRRTMDASARVHRVPVLVAYNLPFRDCAGYSAGGAVDTPAYQAWIDGFARGIGRDRAVVILEPDSLGIIPYNTTIFGATDFCQPTVTGADGVASPAPGASADERYRQLQGAIKSIARAAPQASIYIDGTHSAWLGVGEAAYRIHRAGFDPGTGQPLVRGFFLNVSNYELTDQLVQFGTWVSDCITAATAGASWAVTHFDFCPGQYNPATGFGLDYSAAYAATVTAALGDMMAGAAATMPFVIDTGRNGTGPLDAARFAAPPFNQPPGVVSALAAGKWCNPPGAGVGPRPTASTGVSLLDAYLWIKIPGESDGTCDVAGGARAWDYAQYNPWNIAGDAQDHFDPLWGTIDPVAGAWFPEQALQLARRAAPSLF